MSRIFFFYFEGKDKFLQKLIFANIELREHVRVQNYEILSIPNTALLLSITPNERVDTANVIEGDRY